MLCGLILVVFYISIVNIIYAILNVNTRVYTEQPQNCKGYPQVILNSYYYSLYYDVYIF